MKRLREVVIRWLLADFDARLKDLERHFVTKRDASGQPVETLADVPVHDRKRLLSKPRGLSGPQLLKWLEMTDGGRNIERHG